MQTVTEAISAAVDGSEGPLQAIALKLAAVLDDYDTSARDAAACSRELRQVLGELDLDAGQVDGDVFDLDARRRAREERRGSA